MKKYPVYLNFDEVYKYLNSLKNTDEKINYLKYIIDVYKESFNHKSDKDVDSYISKYNLIGKLENIKTEFPVESLNGHWFEVDDIFTKPFYNLLHEKISYLVRSLTSELIRLKLYKDTIEDGFDLVVFQDQLYLKIESIESDIEKLNWIKSLLSKLRSIKLSFTGKMVEDFLKLYSYNNSFYGIEPVESENDDKSSSKKLSFKHYLENCYLEVVEKEYDNLEMKVYLDFTKHYLANGIKEEDKLYPLWEYNYKKVKYFSDNAFSHIEDKIKYISYVIKCLKIKVPFNLNSNSLYSEYLKLEEELKHLRTTYEMDKSIKSDSNSSLPLKAQPSSGKANIKIEKPDVAVSKSRGSNSTVIKNSLKLKWLGSLKQLKILLYELQDYDFIENHLEDDEEHKQYLSLFVDKNNNNFSENKPSKVIWKSELSELAYLIGEFTKSITKPIIHGNKKWVRTCNVFNNRYGDVIKPRTLSSSYTKNSIVNEQEKLDKIIKYVLKSV